MKKLFVSFLSAVAIFTVTSTGAFADSAPKSSERYTIISEDGYQYLQDSVDGIKYAQPVTAEGENITLEEYKSLLEAGINNQTHLQQNDSSLQNEDVNQTQPNDFTSLAATYKTYEFILSNQLRGADPAYKKTVSAAIQCPGGTGSSPCNIQATWQAITSHTYSAGVEAGWKEYIRLTGTYAFGKQIANGTTYTVPIAPGKTGYLTFTPFIIQHHGKIKTTTYINGYYAGEELSPLVWGKGAELLPSGEANGVYALAYY